MRKLRPSLGLHRRGEVLLLRRRPFAVDFTKVLATTEARVLERQLVGEPVVERQLRGVSVEVPEAVGCLDYCEHPARLEDLPGLLERHESLRNGHVLDAGEEDDKVEAFAG